MATFGFFCLVLLHFNAQQQRLSINQFILQAIHFWIRKLSAWHKACVNLLPNFLKPIL
jgi:hypothetical protein